MNESPLCGRANLVKLCYFRCENNRMLAIVDLNKTASRWVKPSGSSFLRLLLQGNNFGLLTSWRPLFVGRREDGCMTIYLKLEPINPALKVRAAGQRTDYKYVFDICALIRFMTQGVQNGSKILNYISYLQLCRNVILACDSSVRPVCLANGALHDDSSQKHCEVLDCGLSCLLLGVCTANRIHCTLSSSQLE